MGLYDIGRPTAGLAGQEAAGRDRDANRDRDLTFSQKQAEFFDYMDASEHRQVNRQREIEDDRAQMEVLPGKVEATKATNELATAEKKAELELLPAKQKAAVTALHVAANEVQYDKLIRAYAAVEHGLREGQPPESLYAQGRKTFISASQNPEAANKWLTDNGMPEEFSFNNLMTFRNMGISATDNAATWRAEHLLSAKAAADIASARGLKPEDQSGNNKDNPFSLYRAGQRANEVKGFAALDGGLNTDKETPRYTGEKGQMVSALHDFGRTVYASQILGDTINPVDIQYVGIEMLNLDWERYATEGWGVFGLDGDKFNAAKFHNTANSVMAELVNRRNGDLTNPDMNIFQAWQKHGKQIISRIRQEDATHRAMTGQGGDNKPTTPTKATGDFSENAHTPSGRSTQTELQKVKQQIRDLTPKERTKYTNEGKVDTQKYQELKNEMRRLQKLSKETAPVNYGAQAG